MASGIVLPPNFDFACNCSYQAGTTAGGTNVKVSLAALMEVMKSIPEPPRILVMDIKMVKSSVLSGNTILLSKDVADALEEALKGEQTKK